MEITPLAFSVAEACTVSRQGRTAIYEAINSGALRAVKRGRRTIILADDLRAWLAQLPAIGSRSGNGEAPVARGEARHGKDAEANDQLNAVEAQAPADPSKLPDPFDPARLALKANPAEAIGVKHVLAYVAVRTPPLMRIARTSPLSGKPGGRPCVQKSR